VDMRPHELAEIGPNSEEVTVELQRNAAAEVKLYIQVTERFEVDPGVEAVVSHKVCRAR